MKRTSVFRLLDKIIGIPLVIIISLFKKKRKEFPSDIKNILIIKFAAIGDSILIIPMIRKLRMSFPDSKISFLCSPINESVIRKIPYIDNVISSDVHSYIKNPFGLLRFIKIMRRVKYDLIIDTEQWSRISPLMMTLLRYGFSIGYFTEKQKRHYLFDRIVMHTRIKHELETFLDLVNAAGIEINENDRKLEYFLTRDNEILAEKFWNENNFSGKLVICLHPGCGGKGKPREWPVDNYVKLTKRLLEFNPELEIIITGSKSEYDKCNYIASKFKDKVTNIAGLYTLDEVVAIVKRVNLIVCSNTGMLHLASCVGTKTMGLHGPTNPVKWGAYSSHTVLIQSDKYCSPCLYLGHDYGCKAPSCMEHISVDDVFIHIRKALNPELF